MGGGKDLEEFELYYLPDTDAFIKAIKLSPSYVSSHLPTIGNTKIDISEDIEENMERDNGHETIYDQVGDIIGSVRDNGNSFGLPEDDVTSLIEEVLREHPLPFELADFQKKALYELGHLKNVILISPTGSGKMVVAYLAILLLQKRLGIAEGVGLGTQPLSAIMNEKVRTKYLSAGSISMSGNIQCNTDNAEVQVYFLHICVF